MKRLISSILSLCLLSSYILTAKPLFYSQFKQDSYVYETFFQQMTSPGFFVEIGAYDGKWLSNTLFFEKELRWQGICIEPMPHIFEKLKKNRSCICINACITNFSGIADFVVAASSSDVMWAGPGVDPKKVKYPNGVVPKEMLSGLVSKMDPRAQALIGGVENNKTISVNCSVFNDLLDQYKVTHINFLSIDTEGGELDILKSINFDHIVIDVITIEANYQDLRKDIFDHMHTKKYTWIKRLGVDDIYCRSDFPSLSHITKNLSISLRPDQTKKTTKPQKNKKPKK